jgi:hypothetical protein
MKTVVFVHDIFIMHVSRVKALADYLGDKCYRVVLPDCHMGDYIEMGSEGQASAETMSQIPAWLEQHIENDCFHKG